MALRWRVSGPWLVVISGIGCQLLGAGRSWRVLIAVSMMSAALQLLNDESPGLPGGDRARGLTDIKRRIIDAALESIGDAMRTTVTLDDAVLAKAAELTGRTDTATLVRLGLQALVEQESARRLARLGGTDPAASSAPRRRGAAA